jgi:hypothetical protein
MGVGFVKCQLWLLYPLVFVWANVIVDGSSPLPRSLTTADSNCQPLFILRTGRELRRFVLVGGTFFFCQQLTANAYPKL